MGSTLWNGGRGLEGRADFQSQCSVKSVFLRATNLLAKTDVLASRAGNF